jgi:two-component system OmpR family response regulator
LNAVIDRGSTCVKGRQIDLTAREFDLLFHVVRHPGRVFNRAQWLDTVWGYGHDGYEHTVNSHINRLRTKIKQDSTDPEFVVTVWGVGYKLSAPQPAMV